MKSLVILIITIILLGVVYNQEKLLILDKKISGCYRGCGGTYSSLLVTPEFFILEINPAFFGISFDEFTVDDLTPVKIEGYELGTKTTDKFLVYIPRKYKKLYIRGINKFGNDTSLDLSEYDSYVKARTVRNGLDDNEKPKVYLNYPKLTNNFFRTDELYVTLQGKVTDNLGLLSHEINGEKVNISETGMYKKRLKLKLGLNNIFLKAIDINNNVQTFDFVIVRDEIIQDHQSSDVDY